LEEDLKNTKRIVVGTLSGVLMGVICTLAARYGLRDEMDAVTIAYIILNRAVIGFAIGISAIRIHWTLHGTLMGFVFSLPFAAGCLLEPDNVGTAIAAVLLGVVYGILIELITSVLLGARQAQA
jgi:hypothetical protein